MSCSSSSSSSNGPALALTPMSAFTQRPIRWLWDQRLALGKLAIIAGDPGLGKSFLTLDLAARVSRDGIMPDGFEGPCGPVLLISAEDDPADTLLPRLRAAGAVLDRIHFVRGVQLPAVVSRTVHSGTGVDPTRVVDRVHTPARVNGFVLAQVAPLRKTMEAVRPKLIVIDPITAYLGECDSNNNAQVRALLAPLSALAGEFDCCVVAVSHLNKSSEASSKAIYRTAGSLAFVAAARSAWLVSKHKAYPQRRIFAQIKNNLGRDKRAISFEVTDDANTDGRVTWDPTEIDLSADDAVSDRNEPGRPDDARAAATAFLRTELAEGERPRTRLVAEANRADITERALDRAAREIDVIKRPSDENRREMLWSLPGGAEATGGEGAD